MLDRNHRTDSHTNLHWQGARTPRRYLMPSYVSKTNLTTADGRYVKYTTDERRA